jgi:hypothetical protein
MNDVQRKIDSRALLNGMMLVVVGTLFLLDRLRIEDFGDLLRLYWPLIIVFFGVSHLLRRDSMWSGVWLVFTGVWLQMAHLHLFGLTYRNSWPLLLIALGAGITLRAVFDSGVARPKGEQHEQ